VLYDLQYPASIVDATRRILSSLWMWMHEFFHFVRSFSHILFIIWM
jgi:hypothetical protein